MAVRSLTTELHEKAIKELGEDPKRVPEDLNLIREWIFQQPHLKARTNDQWLLCFLRSCKFSLECTKDKLDLFYAMRNLAPEFFSDRDPILPEIQEVLTKGVIIVFPKTADPSGPKIISVRCGLMDSEMVSVVTVVKVMLMILEILFLEDDNCTVAGQCLLIDFLDLPYKFTTQLTPTCIKKIFKCLQDVYPTRVKGAHIINSPSFFITLYNTLKGLLKTKNRDRVKFYDEHNINEMHKEIPLFVLPEEYGGDGGSCDEIAAQWKLKVESYRDWFLEDVQYCTDETKRLGNPKTAEILFGVEGSFRKLEID